MRNRHAEVGALFHAALDQPAAERKRFLNQACPDDHDLRSEVEALLEADADAESFIETPVSKSAESMLADYKTDVFAERQIGPYQVRRKISHGGMGAVYLATQASDGFERPVAIKLIRPGMGSEEIVRRFRAERQTLANLNHPYIAKLIDGGATEDGLPYLVMEYVEGVAIDKYCDQQGLDVAARLDLFRKVCEAVHYAHQNLIVHRDLKPSNILVTEDGTPKLLDFGIAKLLREDGAPMTAQYTQSMMRLMTPEYASPEQVRGTSITTASDVYSLGIILYELLTGCRPYRFSERIQAEFERIVCEVMPERPSSAIHNVAMFQHDDELPSTITAATVTRTRRTTPGKLSRLLAGDIDTIVLMALRKEPQRRYTSAMQLSDDLQRFLIGLPVVAQKDTVRYRASKFIRRNRAAVLATCAIAICLIGATGVTSWQAVLLRRSEAAAQELAVAESKARAMAETNHARAERINKFLQEMLSSVQPAKKGADVSVRALLDEAARKLEIEGALTEDAQAAAILREAIGNSYRSLGKFDEAIKQLQTSLDLNIQEFGPRDERVADSIRALALALNNSGAYEEAAKLYEDALDIYAERLGEVSKQVGLVTCDISTTLSNRGKYAEAERMARAGVETLRLSVDEGDTSLAYGLQVLAAKLTRGAQFDEAEALYREALAIRKAAFGGAHASVAETQVRLGELLVEEGDYAAAEPVLVASIDLRRKLYGEKHYKVAQGLNFLGLMYHRLGELGEAEEYYSESLAINRTVMGDEDFEVAKLVNNIAGIAYERGDYAKAESGFREAVVLFTTVSGAGHPVLATIKFNLARTLHDAGQTEAAEPICRKALAIARAKLRAGHPTTAKILTRLGLILIDRGATAEAVTLLEEALAIRIEKFGESHWLTAQTRCALGACMTLKGDFDEAEKMLLDGHAIIADEQGSDHREAKRAARFLVSFYESNNRPEEAARWRDE